jgi:hypothetical protein
MTNLTKWICIKETTAYNVRSQKTLKIGSIIEVMFPTMIFIDKELSYLEQGDLEKNFITLADWRDKQINSILDDK